MEQGEPQDVGDLIRLVDSREKLEEFISALRVDLAANREAWENWTLEEYLEAMERYVHSMSQAYKFSGTPWPSHDAWRTIARVLYSARIYE